MYKSSVLIFMTFLLAISFFGCSQIDIKKTSISERAIIRLDPYQGMPKVCVEPSPDAATTLSLAFSANTKLSNEATVAIASSLNKADSYIGLRTHSIQLLRDMTYRACEAYLNNGMGKAEYAHMLRRFQKSMIALMAIEQLTGVIKAPSVVVDVSSKTNIVNTMLDQQKSIDVIDLKIIDLNTTIRNLESNATDFNITKKLYTEQLAQYESIKDTISKVQEGTKEALADGKTTTKIGDVNISSNIHSNEVTTLAVVNTVEKVVMELIKADDAPFVCFDYLSNLKNDKNTTLEKYCNNKLLNNNRTDVKVEKEDNNTTTSGAQGRDRGNTLADIKSKSN